jgi:hypothetical protein
MNKTLTIALALGAGLFGGMLTRYIAPPAAHAQDQTAVAKEIRAQSFTLVDQYDHTAGTFAFEPQQGAGMMLRRGTFDKPAIPERALPGRIVLRDAAGHEIWSAGANLLIRPVSER